MDEFLPQMKDRNERFPSFLLNTHFLLSLTFIPISLSPSCSSILSLAPSLCTPEASIVLSASYPVFPSPPRHPATPIHHFLFLTLFFPLFNLLLVPQILLSHSIYLINPTTKNRILFFLFFNQLKGFSHKVCFSH